MLKGEKLSCTSKCCLFLIQYQKRTGIITAFTQGLYVCHIRYTDTCFALYGFDNYASGFFGDQLQVIRVIEADKIHAW